MKSVPLEEFPDYAIDESGQLYSLSVHPGVQSPRKMAGWVDPDGYRQYTLTRKPRRKRYAAHVLVAITYIGPRPSPRHEVRHLDGDPSNNRDNNLKWGTRKQNGEDKVRHGRSSKGSGNPKAKITETVVRMVRALGRGGISKNEISRRLGISNPQVGKIVLRRKGGWSWLPDDEHVAV